MRNLIGHIDIAQPVRIEAGATYTFDIDGENWSGLHVRKRKRAQGWRLYLYFDAAEFAESKTKGAVSLTIIPETVYRPAPD